MSCATSCARAAPLPRARRARPARPARPARRCRCAAAEPSDAPAGDDELAALASGDAEAFLFESGKGGRRLDEEAEAKERSKQAYEDRREAKQQAKFEKSKEEADQLGWDQTDEGWKHAKSRGVFRDLYDVVEGMIKGTVGS